MSDMSNQMKLRAPLHPGFAHRSLALGLIRELFKLYDFFQFRQHLRPNHDAIREISFCQQGLMALTYKFDRNSLR